MLAECFSLTLQGLPGLCSQQLPFPVDSLLISLIFPCFIVLGSVPWDIREAYASSWERSYLSPCRLLRGGLPPSCRTGARGPRVTVVPRECVCCSSQDGAAFSLSALSLFHRQIAHVRLPGASFPGTACVCFMHLLDSGTYCLCQHTF